VVVDEDVVDLVAQVAEARAQPLTGRGGAFGSVTAFGGRFVVHEVGVDQSRDEVGLAAGEYARQ
jgi:hypothetical protein